MCAYLKFPLRPKTEQKLIKLISEMEQTADIRSYNKELANMVNELIDEGMDYFFIQTLKRLKVSILVLKPFELGMNTSIRGLKVVSPKIFKTLSTKQYEQVLVIMKEMIHFS